MGASYDKGDGSWRWVAGPEKGMVFYRDGEELDAFHALSWPGTKARSEKQFLTCNLGPEDSRDWWCVENDELVLMFPIVIEFSPQEEYRPSDLE